MSLKDEIERIRAEQKQIRLQDSQSVQALYTELKTELNSAFAVT